MHFETAQHMAQDMQFNNCISEFIINEELDKIPCVCSAVSQCEAKAMTVNICRQMSKLTGVTLVWIVEMRVSLIALMDH